MIREKEIIFALPNREERKFIAAEVYLNKEAFLGLTKGLGLTKDKEKKKKEIFLKKLVSLKRSCTFAAAYRDSH